MTTATPTAATATTDTTDTTERWWCDRCATELFSDMDLGCAYPTAPTDPLICLDCATRTEEPTMTHLEAAAYRADAVLAQFGQIQTPTPRTPLADTAFERYIAGRYDRRLRLVLIPTAYIAVTVAMALHAAGVI